MRHAFWFTNIFLIGLLACVAPAAAQAPKDKDKEKPKNESPDPNIKPLSKWVAEIRSPDMSIRQQAIQTVVGFGPAAKDAVPNLILSLRDYDASVKGDAAAALGMIAAMDKAIADEDLPKIVAALCERLSSTENQRTVRLQSVLALAQMGPKAKAAIPYLCTATIARDGESWHLRKAVCYTLGRIALDSRTGPDSRAISTLLAGLSDPAAPVRLESVMALSALGLPKPAELEAEKRALERVLQIDSDKNVSIWARVLLIFLDDRNATTKNLAILVSLTKDPDTKIRAAAVRALGTLGAANPKSYPELLAKVRGHVTDLVYSLNDHELEVVLMAISSLAMMAENANAQVMPTLEKQFDDPEAAVRAHIVTIMGNLGDLAKPCLPKIKAMLRDKDQNVAYAAISTLMRIAATDPTTLSALEELAVAAKDDHLKQTAQEAAKYVAERLKKKQ